MKKSTVVFASLIVVIGLFSCKKEKEDNGVSTILKGHVADTIRGISIAGYKIVLTKKVGQTCANWQCLTDFEDVATAYTDEDGDYSITFNYKLTPGQDYYLDEQYYGIPYYHESSTSSGPIISGKTNTCNWFVWKPVELMTGIEVLNNNNGPLNVACLFNGDKTLNVIESISEKSTKKTFSFRTRPNSDVKMDFWYYTGIGFAPVRHDKIVPVRTTLNDVTTLDVTVDCSTF